MGSTTPLGAASEEHVHAEGALSAFDAHAPIPGTDLIEEIRSRSGVIVTRCYQCGKCSAGCPMGSEMTVRPHDILRLVLFNKRADALRADGIWLCVTCETCSSRCPNNADPARVIETLREIAIEEDPTIGPRSLSAFHRSFLDQVKSSGRMFEVGLALQYNIRSGNLLQDAGNTPALLTRGKFHVMPTSIKNVSEVRRIFSNVEKVQRATARRGGAR